MKATKAKKSSHKSHSFRLIFAGPAELTDELEKAVWDAGCDDALLGVVDGVPFLAFHRRAPSFRDALRSAIDATERAGLELVRVEPE